MTKPEIGLVADISVADPLLIAPARAPALGPSHLAICLTLYNEPGELLRASLESILAGLDALNRSQPDYSHATICVFADGAEHLTACARRQLETLDLAPFEPDLPSFEGKAFACTIEGARMAPRLGRERPSGMEISICLFAKAENAGKLDSHARFYDGVCPRLDPAYCFQIDAGTILAPEAFHEICALFETEPDVAAIASNVLINPASDSSLLHRFQCADFAIQKTTRWPSEVLSGYLSVVPGQFSGVRWRALSRDAGDGHGTPKDRYLGDQRRWSATQRLRYLCEDRILGFELATQAGAGNRLAFAPQAICHTDACADISDLLQQRRRWVNGSLFSRSWMIGQLARLQLDPERGWREKLRFAPVLLNFSVQALLEWFLPLLTVLILATTWGSLQSLTPTGQTLKGPLVALFSVIVALWLLPAMLAVSGHLKTWSKRATEKLLWLAAMSFCLVALINIVARMQTVAVVEGLYFLVIPATLAGASLLGAALLSDVLLRGLSKTVLSFIVLAPSLWLMLSAHAFVNLHDDSWGTKGLLKAKSSDQTAARRRSLQSIRWIILSCWIGSNILAAIAILCSDQRTIWLLVAGAVQIAVIVSGLVGAGWISLGQARRTPAPSPAIAG